MAAVWSKCACGDGRGQRRIDPARQTEEHLFETALSHIITKAEFKGRQRLGLPRFGDLSDLSNRALETFEIPGPRDDLSLAVEDHRVAIEYEVVVGTHLVGIDEETAGVLRIPPDELASFARLAELKGARRKVDQNLGAAVNQLEHRVPVVETVAVEIWVGPHILTHRHSDTDTLEDQRPRIRPRLEVAGLVKNIVGGQEAFEIALHHLSPVAQRDRVVEALAGPRLVAVDKADQDAEIVIRKVCDPVELGEVAIDEVPPLQEVSGRIADGGELGENHKIGRLTTRTFDSYGHLV